MENTGKILFEDDTPQWFLAMGDRWVGPLAASDVYDRVMSGQITLAHYAWKEGQADWKRICDIKTFQAAVPTTPHVNVKEMAKAQPPGAPGKGKSSPPTPPKNPLEQPKEWFLYYNDTQFGPFSEDEINRYIEIGKIHSKVYVWKDGMPNWDRLDGIKLFAPLLKESESRQSSRERKSAPLEMDNKNVRLEQRRGLRTPLVAKVVIAAHSGGTKGGGAVAVGMCRDISVGGMQVLTDAIPGRVGSVIKLNVSPSEPAQASKSGKGAGSAITPFVAEGVIVRLLEDGRGFSFRFEKLSAQAKASIEAYIESSDS